ncbi:MAG: hypothetical protein NDI84_12160, partial [Steroidobacteraceae bacterium]|nr:hypothetical protein [Steroidobacteraceae bacterium]
MILHRVFACIAASAVLTLAGPAGAATDPLAKVRAEFQSAYAAVETAPMDVDAAGDSEALRKYPLYPYLQAARLQRRLADPSAAGAIEAFLAEHGSAPAARSLRRSWLMTLAMRKAWEPYLAAYREDVDDSVAARCNAL